MRSLSAVGAAIALLIAASPALAADPVTSETAASGAIGATLTYTLPETYAAAGITVAITRDGVTAAVQHDGRVGADCRLCVGVPIGANGGLNGAASRSLTVADLTGDGDPEVIVDLYTGGAHCCSVSAIYGWDAATASYRRLVKLWGDPSYTLKALGAGPGQELITNDPRFAYTFCAYVCSAMPVRVFRYQDFRLVDVTEQFPQQMRAQNRGLRQSIRELSRRRADRFAIRGMLPALCANLYRLGAGASCRRELDRALSRGWLTTGTRLENETWAGGRRYVRGVLRFLRKNGYR